MKALHPASQILLGAAFLLAASTRDGASLFWICLVTSGGALAYARRHALMILRRSRWLLLTMVVLFGWMTPGTPVAGLPAATDEGLRLAAESVARLLIAISVVAVLLNSLPPPALVAGLRSLLSPLACLGAFRDQLAVRLMLTLQAVEAVHRGGEGNIDAAPSLSLPVTSRGPADYVAVIASAALFLIAALA